MKKQVLVMLSFFMSVALFAQKKELKAAEKALKSGKISEVKAALSSVEGSIEGADHKYKTQFYFLKGKSLLAEGKNEEAGVALNKLIEIDPKGKSKYTAEAAQSINQIVTKSFEAAKGQESAKDYANAAKNYELVYKLSPKDTFTLFKAADAYYLGKEYAKSIEKYKELLSTGYTGINKKFVAENSKGELVSFANAKEMNFALKTPEYKNGRTEVSKSLRPAIYKTIGAAYRDSGKNEEALNFIQDARKSNPEDLDLIISEANIHIANENYPKVKDLLSKAVEKDPKNHQLYYIIAISYYNMKDAEGTKQNIDKALALKPDYAEASILAAQLLIDKGNVLNEEMNNTGTSSSETAKYDRLLEEKTALYNQAAKMLEDARKLSPNNKSMIKTLKSIYSVTGETAKYKEMSALLRK